MLPSDAARPPPSLPDRLSQARLLAVPLLWLLALAGEPVLLGIGVAVAAATDVADGIIARRTGVTTERGSRLDSLADHSLTLSALIWIVWLRGDFVRDHAALLLLWMVVGSAALLVGWLRFHRFGALHLYSAKMAGTLGYLLAIGVLVFDWRGGWAADAVLGLCVVAAFENLLTVSTRSRVDERIGSILLRRR